MIEAMTCQVCGRLIKARTGAIAHHGYQRPGFGWQTSSCMGARALPFEASRDKLAEWIEVLRDLLRRNRERQVKIENETTELAFSFFALTVRREETIYLTRDTFEASRSEHKNSFNTHSLYSFEILKARSIARAKREETQLQSEIAHQTKRHNEWRQSHVWATNHWKEI